MHAFLVLLSAALLSRAVQVAFNTPSPPPDIASSTGEWDFSRRPAPNATSHLIFDNVNSLLQHWPNTRYRNGHSIVPGVVPPGTLLYHGTYKGSLPDKPDWVATDPEHSYLFCRGLPEGGCWHLTLVTARPLRVLYFDGSSAAKMNNGPMDSQDILIWKDVVPEKTWDEVTRIKELCRVWGDRVDGFVRMEMDFEIMLCDFTKGVEVASFLKIKGRGWVPPRGPKNISESGKEAENYFSPAHENDILPPYRSPKDGKGVRSPRRPPRRPPLPHFPHLPSTGPAPPPPHSSHGPPLPPPPYFPYPPPHSPSLPPTGPTPPPHKEPPHLPPPPHFPHLPPTGPPPPPHDRPPHRGPHHGKGGDVHQFSKPASSQGIRDPGFAVFESGSWHNRYPGETRIQLDLTRFNSFYDIVSFPSLVEKRDGQERWDYRLEGISEKEVEALWAQLNELLMEEAWTGRRGSGVDWKTLYWSVLERYADRLEALEFILVNATTATESVSKAQSHVTTMLAPYLLHSAVLPDATDDISASNHSWAAGVFKYCATTHTSYISSSLLTSLLTPSEKLLLRTLEDVNREICRVLVGLWAEGVENGIDSDNDEEDISTKEDRFSLLAEKWADQTRGLMQWLDWSVWVKCRPACSFEEMCYLPTWPFFNHRPKGPQGDRPGPSGPPGSPGPPKDLDHNPHRRSLIPGEDTDDWERPQPKCIRRM